MFVTASQIYVAAAALAFGGVCGVLFSVSAFIKKFLSGRAARIVPDVAAFTVFTALFALFSFALNFPSHRPYMTVAALTGLYLYMKSFHIILDFLAEKLYNKIKCKLKFTREKKGKDGNVSKTRQRRAVCRGSGNGSGAEI